MSDGCGLLCFQMERFAVKDRNSYEVKLFRKRGKHIIKVKLKLPSLLTMIRVLGKIVGMLRLKDS